jgi:hypothetical protein
MLRTFLTQNDRFRIEDNDRSIWSVTVICEEWAQFIWAQRGDGDWIDRASLISFRGRSRIYDEVAFLRLDTPPDRPEMAWFIYRVNARWFLELPKGPPPAQWLRNGVREWEHFPVVLEDE